MISRAMREGFALLLIGWLALSVAFFGVEVFMGGCAQNGKVESGRFYLGQHGKFREVSRAVYVASAVGTWVWVAYGVVLIPVGGFLDARDEKRPRFFPLLVIILILFLGGLMTAFSYSTYNCIMSAREKV